MDGESASARRLASSVPTASSKQVKVSTRSCVFLRPILEQPFKLLRIRLVVARMSSYNFRHFNVTFPSQYVAHVEINRSEKMNAFFEA